MSPPANPSAIAILTPQEPRTLAHVLLDIAAAERANSMASFRFYAADAAGDQKEATRQGDIGAEIDDRISDLRREAEAMIQTATGVSWEQLYEALA